MRSNSIVSKGFSLIELLIAIAILGVVMSVGIPAYQGYLETAKMTKVSAAYDFSVRLAQQTYSKDSARIAMGLASTLPDSTTTWLELFDEDDESLAPGGGPLFISGRPRNRRVISETGAINVRFNRRKQRLEIYRPNYKRLKGYRAIVTRDETILEEWSR